MNPLAEAAAAWIADSALTVVAEARGSMHKVYIVERPGDSRSEAAADASGADPSGAGPELEAYLRDEARFKLADSSYRAKGFWGLPEFDTPSYGSAVAADLASRACAGVRDALFIDPGVGHMAIWAARELGVRRVTAASRDALSLRAVGINLSALPERSRPSYDSLDALGAAELPSDAFDLVVESPDVVPERDWIGPAWALAERVLRRGGVYLAYCSPTEMTRLEKRRPSGGLEEAAGGGRARWSLLGQKRKKGFIASAWRKG